MFLYTHIERATSRRLPKTPKHKPAQKRSPNSKETLEAKPIPLNLECCGIAFTKITSFKRHLDRKHPKDVNNDGVECPVCSKVFMHKDNLVQHQKSHKKKIIIKKCQRFICENCKRKFTKKSSLIRHFSDRNCTTI